MPATKNRSTIINKWNGCCPESGYDKFEQQVREEFIEYAKRRRHNCTLDADHPWVFVDKVVDEIWRAYHNGHVRGRMFDCGRINEELSSV